MPSHLRLQSTLEQPIAAHAIYQQTSPTLPPRKKQKMSLTSIYTTASTARTKLGREASKPDHDLRRLVGSANMLDNLMLQLAEAEREQEAWFDASVQSASRSDEPRRVQWMDSIAEDMEDDSDSDVDSDDEEDEEMFNIPLRKMRSPPVAFSSADLEYDDEEALDDEYEDEDSDDNELTLTRSPSKQACPQLLDDDSDSESEDECPSPDNTMLPLSEKQRKQITTTAFYDMQVAQPQAITAAC